MGCLDMPEVLSETTCIERERVLRVHRSGTSMIILRCVLLREHHRDAVRNSGMLQDGNGAGHGKPQHDEELSTIFNLRKVRPCSVTRTMCQPSYEEQILNGSSMVQADLLMSFWSLSRPTVPMTL